MMFDWLWSLIAKFVGWLLALLPAWLGNGFDELSSAFGPLAKYVGYLSGFDAVVPITITAFIVRFFIRRLPVIG